MINAKKFFLANSDTSYFSDRIVKHYLELYTPLYPDIVEWYNSEVTPDLRSGNKTIYVAAEDTKILGLAITLNKDRAKLCYISVLAPVRRIGLGRMLIANALYDLKRKGSFYVNAHMYKEIAIKYGGFFTKSGFKYINEQENSSGQKEAFYKLYLK